MSHGVKGGYKEWNSLSSSIDENNGGDDEVSNLIRQGAIEEFEVQRDGEFTLQVGMRVEEVWRNEAWIGSTIHKSGDHRIRYFQS